MGKKGSSGRIRVTIVLGTNSMRTPGESGTFCFYGKEQGKGLNKKGVDFCGFGGGL